VTEKRKFIFTFLAVGIGFALPLLLAELSLRLLPVNAGFDMASVNEKSPVLRFMPNQTAWFSRGWNFPIKTRVHFNNEGWRSDFDYEKNKKPLLAVIGDSFIEASQVKWEESIPALLHGKAPSEKVVYGFGVSYAPLSQYLAMAKHVKENYNLSALVVSVVGNDFDESLIQYKQIEGLHYFNKNEKTSSLELIRTDFYSKRKLHHYSHLYLYLSSNCEFYGFGAIQGKIANLAKIRKNESFGHKVLASSQSSELKRDRIEESQKAVDRFLELLPDYAGLEKNKILFTVDAERLDIYETSNREQSVEKSFFAIMRKYFIKIAKEKGCEVIDLEPIFKQQYLKNSQKFEFDCDGHWNQTGHRTVADEIVRTRVWTDFIRLKHDVP